jgi:predicted acetyltransferase
MDIQLKIAEKGDLSTLQDLSILYMYDMSRYCGFLPDWKLPPNGIYKNFDFSVYFKDPNRHPFLIYVDEEIAGFALVNKIGSHEKVDWNMAEFFIHAKFQGKNIGSYIAKKLFNQFPGIWEVCAIPENTKANVFWEHVIEEFTKGKFEKQQKTILEPKPHPMIVRSFDSSLKNSTRDPYIVYHEHSSQEEENILINGIIEEASLIKQMNKICPFSFFMKNTEGKTLAGIKGVSLYGCLYIDLLWVSPEHRHKGYGMNLVQAAEDLGRQRNCTFVCLSTMDWEALPFYQKLGYEIEFTRLGYQRNSKMYLLRKKL